MRRLASAAAFVLVITTACGGGDDSEPATSDTVATSTTVATTAATTAATTTAATTGTPTTAATTTAAPTTTEPPAPPAVWVTNTSAGKVFKVDPADGSVMLDVEVGAGAAGVALGAGSAWVAVGSTGAVVRVDAESGEILATIDVDDGGTGAVAFSDGSVWVSSFAGNAVYEIDPATNAVVGSTDIQGATGLAPGSLWATSWTDQSLTRIPTDGSAALFVELSGPGSSPAVGDGYVAATVFTLGEVLVFPFDGTGIGDPVTYDVGANANVVDYAFGAFWVTNSVSGEIWRIDPAAGTAEAVTVIPVATSIRAGDDMIYVTAFNHGTVYQFPPDNPSAMADLVNIGDNAFELAVGSPG